MEEALVTQEEIEDAYQKLQEVVSKTPLQKDDYLSQKYACEVYLKREDLQKVRSFKLRGAYYAISQLPQDVLARGVVCASAGNHAQGVAYTCQQMNVPATIFMPSTTPNQKITQVEFFGGECVTIQLIGDTFDSAALAAKDYAVKTGQAFIPPFDDAAIIAGQGTVAVEIFHALQEPVDYLFVPVGGGGLISGVAAYTKAVQPQATVIGVEPSGAASLHEAVLAGEVIELQTMDKFVDGAAVRQVGSLNLRHTQALVDRLVQVDEGLVCGTILELYTKQAIVAEPAGALSVAALELFRNEIKGKRVVCIVSGGNNDINRMQEIEERTLLYEGLKHYFVVNFPQRPGALKEFVTDILGPNDDITKFEYTKKVNRGSGPVIIGVLLNQADDYHALVERLQVFDPEYIDLSDNHSLYTLLV